MPSDSKIVFRCPHCNKKVSIAQQHAGRRGRCPNCLEKVQIPREEDILDFDTLVERSMNELHQKTSIYEQAWHLSEADWNLDQNSGKLVFTTPEGIAIICPVQIIGTFNTSEKTWRWGWGQQSVAPSLQEHARRCKTYGEQHGLRALTSHKLTNSTEDDCWQLTALACKLAGAQGGYRGHLEKDLVFVTIGEPRLRDQEH